MNKSKYENGLNRLRKKLNIAWIAEFFGEFNLGLSIFFKNSKELSLIIDEIYKLFGNSIVKKDIHYIEEHIMQNMAFSKIDSRDITRIGNNQEVLQLSNLEKEIISQIKDNSRFLLIDLSKKIKKKPETIKNCIKGLEKKGLIKKYKILLNYNSLGYVWSLCIITIIPGKDAKELLSRLKFEFKVPFISKTIENNLIVDVISRDYSELKEFLNKLKEENNKVKDFSILNLERLIKLKDSICQ